MVKPMGWPKITLSSWSVAAIYRTLSIRLLLEVFAVYLAIQLTIMAYSSQTISRMSNGLNIDHGRLQRGRYDNQRLYIIQDSVFVGADWPTMPTGQLDHADVCLATQTSVNKLHHVVEVARHWQGLMSVAVFTPGLDHPTAVAHLRYLAECQPEVMRNVSVHFVFPARTSSSSPERQLLYPQNLMRNVARKNCASDFVLLTDVDVVPVFGLGPRLRKFVQSMDQLASDQQLQRVYVLPTYEMDSNASVSLPVDKAELLQLVRANKTRSYRIEAFKPNQGATNTAKWEALTANGSTGADVAVAYELPAFKFYYEPFYLAKDSVPPHDERFAGYGFTRNTQVYEMLLAGYKFFVLDTAFLVHRGMDNSPFTSSTTSGRKTQVERSWMNFVQFMGEIQVRHKTYNVWSVSHS